MAQISELPLRFDSKAISSPCGATVEQLENCEVSFVISSVAVAVMPSPLVRPPTDAVHTSPGPAVTKVAKVLPAPVEYGALQDGLTKISMNASPFPEKVPETVLPCADVITGAGSPLFPPWSSMPRRALSKIEFATMRLPSDGAPSPSS
jgi:hypothetical protein